MLSSAYFFTHFVQYTKHSIAKSQKNFEEKDPAKIVKKALLITAELCIYTNNKITILKS